MKDAERAAIILVLVSAGGGFLTAALPEPFTKAMAGAVCLLLAYVYANLTRSRSRP